MSGKPDEFKDASPRPWTCWEGYADSYVKDSNGRPIATIAPSDGQLIVHAVNRMWREEKEKTEAKAEVA